MDSVRTCDDHDGVGLGDHSLQEDDVGVLELPHDARLGEEVHLGLDRAARLERLDGHKHVWRELYKNRSSRKIDSPRLFQEHRTSRRRFLLQRISFAGRPILIQFVPVRSGAVRRPRHTSPNSPPPMMASIVMYFGSISLANCFTAA